MQIFLKDIKIDNRTEGYIKKRLISAKKLLNGPIKTEIEIDINKKGKFRVEIMLKDPRNLYRAEETTESIEGSVDMAIDQIKKQIKKIKGRKDTLLKRGERSIRKKLSIDKLARL